MRGGISANILRLYTIGPILRLGGWQLRRDVAAGPRPPIEDITRGVKEECSSYFGFYFRSHLLYILVFSVALRGVGQSI